MPIVYYLTIGIVYFGQVGNPSVYYGMPIVYYEKVDNKVSCPDF